MKLKINPGNLFTALIFAMIVSALVHLFICFFLALTTGNPDHANMFNILGISYLFPGLGTGTLNALLGILLVIAIGTVAYYYKEAGNPK